MGFKRHRTILIRLPWIGAIGLTGCTASVPGYRWFQSIQVREVTGAPNQYQMTERFKDTLRSNMTEASEIHPAATYQPVLDYPWPKGRSFTIASAFNDNRAHKGAYGYAVDIIMPMGSPVCAAREGIVTAVQSSHAKGGNDPGLSDKVNYIMIRHPDGSTGRYMHLKKDGVLVKKGHWVEAGDLIGYSGNTGWATGPHLHFDIVAPGAHNLQFTLPFRFRRPDGTTFIPTSGMRLDH